MVAKKSKNKNQNKNQWEDHLTRKAKSEKYPARSIYKLEEIQNRCAVVWHHIYDRGSELF